MQDLLNLFDKYQIRYFDKSNNSLLNYDDNCVNNNYVYCIDHKILVYTDIFKNNDLMTEIYYLEDLLNITYSNNIPNIYFNILDICKMEAYFKMDNIKMNIQYQDISLENIIQTIVNNDMKIEIIKCTTDNLYLFEPLLNINTLIIHDALYSADIINNLNISSLILTSLHKLTNEEYYNLLSNLQVEYLEIIIDRLFTFNLIFNSATKYVKLSYYHDISQEFYDDIINLMKNNPKIIFELKLVYVIATSDNLKIINYFLLNEQIIFMHVIIKLENYANLDIKFHEYTTIINNYMLTNKIKVG